MANYRIKLNLLRLPGAFVSTLKGKSAQKRCLCIPIDEAQIFVGQKGCYLDLSAWELRVANELGNSHYIKQRLSRQAYTAMSDEARRAMPIVGDMSPRQDYDAAAQPARPAPPIPAPAVGAQQEAPIELDEDLPF